MIMGSDVFTPWPISGCFETIVTAPDGAMRMKALGAKPPLAAAVCAWAEPPDRM
jgi:hypothetical protein